MGLSNRTSHRRGVQIWKEHVRRTAASAAISLILIIEVEELGVGIGNSVLFVCFNVI